MKTAPQTHLLKKKKKYLFENIEEIKNVVGFSTIALSCIRLRCALLCNYLFYCTETDTTLNSYLPFDMSVFISF